MRPAVAYCEPSTESGGRGRAGPGQRVISPDRRGNGMGDAASHYLHGTAPDEQARLAPASTTCSTTRPWASWPCGRGSGCSTSAAGSASWPRQNGPGRSGRRAWWWASSPAAPEQLAEARRLAPPTRGRAKRSNPRATPCDLPPRRPTSGAHSMWPTPGFVLQHATAPARQSSRQMVRQRGEAAGWCWRTTGTTLSACGRSRRGSAGCGSAHQDRTLRRLVGNDPLVGHRLVALLHPGGGGAGAEYVAILRRVCGPAGASGPTG